MNYSIHITRAAERDIAEATDYIDNILLNPEAADSLLDKLNEQGEDLMDSPAKYQLADDPVLRSWGIRFTLVNNYLAFYIIDEEKRIVHIIRFLYGKRDWINILKLGYSLN
ncbi:MAG: type II toxin-antitoxin system RelE/ParE family toxin [Oscillospiraceae bacterium]|nr:type II toxin-antitoxin system RelE/ParE family toxin [Oscillospiraceae bacterium]